MRRRYGGLGTTRRVKKIRPIVRVREKILKRGGKCAACRGRYEKGDRVTVVSVKHKVYHTGSCVPANAHTLAIFGGVSAAGPVAKTPADVVAALSSAWAPGEAKLVAIQALENAMVAIAKSSTAITPEMEKAFAKYNKLKSMFMRPGSEQEGKQAAKLSVLEVVKAFF